MVGRDGNEDDFEGRCVGRIAGGAWNKAAPTDVALEGEEFRRCLPVVGVGSEAVDGPDGLCDWT